MREKNQETRADIIAEMRMGSPCGPCAYRIGLPDKEEVFESGATMRTIQIKDVTVQELADRLEAAAKREKAQPGNAAKMREALELFVEYSELVCRMGIFTRDRLVEITTKARAALAAPPRNCDVGTPEEQSERFAKHCDRFHRCNGCPCCGKVKYNRCEYFWAQMPYEAKEGARSD